MAKRILPILAFLGASLLGGCYVAPYGYGYGYYGGGYAPGYYRHPYYYR